MQRSCGGELQVPGQDPDPDPTLSAQESHQSLSQSPSSLPLPLPLSPSRSLLPRPSWPKSPGRPGTRLDGAPPRHGSPRSRSPGPRRCCPSPPASGLGSPGRRRPAVPGPLRLLLAWCPGHGPRRSPVGGTCSLPRPPRPPPRPPRSVCGTQIARRHMFIILLACYVTDAELTQPHGATQTLLRVRMHKLTSRVSHSHRVTHSTKQPDRTGHVTRDRNGGTRGS